MPALNPDQPALLRLQGAGIPLTVLLLWELVVRQGWVQAHLLPPPSELAATLWDLTRSGALIHHIGISSARVFLGFSAGSILALLLGGCTGLSRRAEAWLDPSFQALRAIPSLAWVPLLLLWLGIDESPKITLIAIGAFFPVYINTVAGIHNVDRKWVELGRMYGLRGIRLWGRIFVPGCLPHLFTGLRTGLSLAWMFLVAAELMAATQGLGYLLTDGRETGRADLVMAAILVLAALGKLSDSLLRALELHLLAWRDRFDTPAGT